MRLLVVPAAGLVLFTGLTSSIPVPQLSDGTLRGAESKQLSINESPSDVSLPNTTLPIAATVFRGVPGPKNCRGLAMAVLNLPQPAQQYTTEMCYDLAGPAGCGLFVANKADGCEARLFAERRCWGYMNTVVFLPEPRAVGGNWRSMAVRCRAEPPDPDGLGGWPLAGIITK